MLSTYADCIKEYSNGFALKKAVDNKELFKVDLGLYSDKKYEPELSIIAFRYPNAVFTLDSAFYYHGLTDYVPDKYFLATPKDAYKIRDKRVKQVFYLDKQFDFGITEIIYENTKIKIYDKERMLIELIRRKNKTPFDYYKEIINNYRKIVDELDMSKIEKYIKKYNNTDTLLKTLQLEVF